MASCVGVAQQEQAHSREYWREIKANHFAVPKGVSAYELLKELSGFLGSPDAELRDDLAYEIAAAWIYRDPKLSSLELHDLSSEWQQNLKIGIGQGGTDSVLRRSFSALSLSLIAARDWKVPVMNQADFNELLSNALEYLRAETDLRGLEPRVGWIHATAHTADLLKFLARNPKLGIGDQQRILDAISNKLKVVGEPFTHGENERLARAVLSLVVRPDAQSEPLAAFVETLRAREEEVWRNGNLPEPAQYSAALNGRDLLKSLCVLLDQQPTLSPLASGLRAKILEAIGQ